jgi:glycosyltransferase involved in cell wall biosynthesis
VSLTKPEAVRAGVDSRIIAIDAVHPIRELPNDYQAADICIQASLEEGLGFSPLEAAACGVPVVASSVGGLKENIIDGVTGWTYTPGDAQTLANRIAAVISSPEEARRRAEAAYAMVARKFDRTMVFSRLEDVIRAEVASRRRDAE